MTPLHRTLLAATLTLVAGIVLYTYDGPKDGADNSIEATTDATTARAAADRPRSFPDTDPQTGREQRDPVGQDLPAPVVATDSHAEADDSRDPERTTPTPGEVVVGPVPSATAEAARAAAELAVMDALENTRAKMGSDCWDGSDHARVGEDGIELSMSISFNATGQAVTSSVSQPRDAQVPGLERCLAPFVHGIEVPPSGTPVGVDVTFHLP